MLCALAGTTHAADDTLHVGSKRFTESYILGEVLTQVAAPHAKVTHLQGLGNTAIVLAALQAGRIDVYAEYLGTIDLEILKHPQATSLEQIRKELATMGLGVAVPLGFNNTYSLAMRGDAASVKNVADLARQPALRFGLSHEFIGRADGWPGLAQRYGLPQRPQGLDHGLAYEALRQGQTDVIDIYSTDAKIRQYGLRVLDDNLGYFPRYDAVLLYRLDAAKRFPAAWNAIEKLEGRISADAMIAMNASAEIDGKNFTEVARAWLAAGGLTGATAKAASSTAAPSTAALTTAAPTTSAPTTGASTAADARLPSSWRTGLAGKIFDDNLGRLTRQHLTLVLVAVGLACLAGVPLGVLAAVYPRLRQVVLGVTGVLQTVPSLALLALLIPLLGMIGTVPALIALVVYALLPIVRNTCTGLLQVSPGLRMAALALGLRPGQRLWLIELPLALPVILAGVKTAAVMSVGTATIAAFIGAGGFGERITIGLALNDNQMLLAGAIPAAVLALLTQAVFELLERVASRAPAPRL
ncbi:glycine betaine ABC transporter substrate-binding protein [Duganella sp. FT27W]|uniref:glycine betaine ABC transporter substrate-binding protein n=1 Tax=Duganella sp. FT27W TaxID=2654636 RepID=UPI00128B9269|nr:glycine betaine ABC transporter substrate-binding protein [Duganella sp. FT27W]MPQ60057.1 ABC transporter permease subunit [Duganella sp. FT27W]